MDKSSASYRLNGLATQRNIRTEMRAFKRGAGLVGSKWFGRRSIDELHSTAEEWEGEGITLAITQSRPVEFDQRTALKDEGVDSYCRLLFDFDRVKSYNRNASERELSEALKVRDYFAKLMADFGWPDPVFAVSGNGGHLLYQVGLYRSPVTQDKISRLYRGLSEQVSTSTIKLDTTTTNPAQLCRLYGFVNRKYPHTTLHPQRMAYAENVEDEVGIMNIDAINAAVEAFGARPVAPPVFPKSNTPYIGGHRVDWKTLDIVSWFRAKGLYIKPLASGKHAVYCPWERSGAHEKSCNSDTVIWETSSRGFPQFNCSHDTCKGRGLLVELNEILGDMEQYCRRAAS